MSHTDTRHQAAGFSQQYDKSELESNPVASKEDASSKTEAENVDDNNSQFLKVHHKSPQRLRRYVVQPNEH